MSKRAIWNTARTGFDDGRRQLKGQLTRGQIADAEPAHLVPWQLAAKI